MPRLENRALHAIFPTFGSSVPSALESTGLLRYKRLFETAPDAILVMSADSGRIVDANPRMAELLGRSREELMGRRSWDIEPLHEIAAATRALQDRRSKGPVRVEGIAVETGGRTRRVDLVAGVLVVGGDRLIQCTVREPRRRPAPGSGTATTLARELHRARRTGGSVCVGLFLVDGAAEGTAVAELLQSRIRGSDHVGADGRERVVLVLPEMTLDDARRRIGQLRAEIERLTSATVSAAVAAGPQHGASADGLLRAVDQALRAATV